MGIQAGARVAWKKVGFNLTKTKTLIIFNQEWGCLQSRKDNIGSEKDSLIEIFNRTFRNGA